MISQFGNNISKRIIPKVCVHAAFDENETGVAETVSRGNASHSLTAVWDSGGLRPTLSWEQLIKGGAHVSPVAASSSDSKKKSIFCWVDSFLVVVWQSPVSLSRPYGDFLLHNPSSSITRQWRLSHEVKVY